MSDQDGSVAASYGVLRENVEFLVGHNHRAIFVINRDQRVEFAWIAKDPSLQPDYGTIMEIIRSMGKWF